MASQIELIKQLREQFGAGIMDVKRALEDSNGDLDAARGILKERGQAIAEKKSSREATEGLIESYVHFNGRVGVLVHVNCETDFVARTADFKEFCHDLALHVASVQPLPLAVGPDDISAEKVQEERQKVDAEAAEMGKPENITRQIVEGRMNKWISEQALLTQGFVKEPEKTIEELLQETIQKVGENVVIRRFVRYEL